MFIYCFQRKVGQYFKHDGPVVLESLGGRVDVLETQQLPYCKRSIIQVSVYNHSMRHCAPCSAALCTIQCSIVYYIVRHFAIYTAVLCAM